MLCMFVGSGQRAVDRFPRSKYERRISCQRLNSLHAGRPRALPTDRTVLCNRTNIHVFTHPLCSFWDQITIHHMVRVQLISVSVFTSLFVSFKSKYKKPHYRKKIMFYCWPTHLNKIINLVVYL